MLKRPLPIGVDDYRAMKRSNYYYVDKTLLIKEVLDNGADSMVNLITRPRRFGKTLGLSTIRTFFECVVDVDGNPGDNSPYFEGTKIMEAGEAYTSHMGKYPVIKLSLKSAKQPTYEKAYRALADEITGEYTRHRYVLKSDKLTKDQRKRYEQIMDRETEDYERTLAFLSECLAAYHGQPCIILIDEYDVPLENAYFEGFYDPMVKFIRSLFESALKTNEHLAFSVVTGCLRISKESIFTGLNNLKINSVIDNNFAEYFGLTQPEVDELLAFYKISDKAKEVREWYDGYLFGDTEVYNPWSVINYADYAITNSVPYPRPYWSNTSSNGIVRELVEDADTATKDELEKLIAGGTIEKQVHEDITYDSIHQSQDNLWNFLFFTGYLKAVSKRFENNFMYLTMEIPNQEVRYIYQNTIREWFEQDFRGRTAERARFEKAVLAGDCAGMQEALSGMLSGVISYYDNAESFYHGFLIGALNQIKTHRMKSNRERGDGRPDILLEPYNYRNPVIIFEIKRAKKLTGLEAGCDAALSQIEEKRYAAEYEEEGYPVIMKYGVSFYKTNCMVKKA